LSEISNSKRVAFYTLGCKLNFAETSMISQKFISKGYKKVSFESEADIYIINTCSVTQVADKKCRQAIKKTANRGAKVIVIGCYSQLKPEEISAIKGVDLVLGTKEKFNIIEHVESLLKGENIKILSCEIGCVETYDASYSISDRTRAFLKVQDGCDYTCSYCTIPLARGKSRNESIAATVEKAKIIAARGVKEVVLTGVNIGDFGKSTGESFFQLMQELNSVEGIERYRISSIEPNLLTKEILEYTVNSEKFLPHFHIPLQSGCDKILALMSRRYKRELFAQRVELIKQIMPNACIGADVIVGFPGETEEDFDDTFNFIENINLSYLHVFPYSERANTKAITIDKKIDPAIKDNRCQRLTGLSELKRKNFYEENLGRTEIVIFESKIVNNKMSGFTGNYIKSETDYNKELIGKTTRVKLMNINDKGSVEVEII
jgi:threonylcarbamoyladenosine tRNA methylthiotransferase MtaB